jgi:glycosyltransferase involved in cell wall biosynthesis
MRVVQLGPYPPPYGGVQINLVAIREHLRRNGIPSEVINLTRHRKPSADGVYYPKSALATALLLLRPGRRIIHLHVGGAVPLRILALCLFCSWCPGSRAILTFHSGGYPSSSEGRAAKPDSFRGFVFRQFDCIIAVNQELVDVFRRYGVRAERIRLIPPHAVDVAGMDTELPGRLAGFYESHRPVLASVGLLEPEYDLPIQIEVLGRVRQHFPDAGLVMIGSGALEQELRDRISSTPYAAHILLTGDVPHSSTLRAISAADVFLRTTLYDGDAVSVRESLVLGTPVIATDNGMRPEGVRLVPVSDVEALAQAILAVVPRDRQPVSPLGNSASGNLDAVLQLYRDLDRELQ